MDWHYASATNGNVVETGRLKLDGTGQQHATLALGFAGTTSAALSAAQASLASGFPAVSSAYAAGWHDYLSSLKPPPASLTTARQRTTYDAARRGRHRRRRPRADLSAGPPAETGRVVPAELHGGRRAALDQRPAGRGGRPDHPRLDAAPQRRTTYHHVKDAADYILANGPSTPQERWENQDGYSPARRSSSRRSSPAAT
jgi:glucoamylase